MNKKFEDTRLGSTTPGFYLNRESRLIAYFTGEQHPRDSQAMRAITPGGDNAYICERDLAKFEYLSPFAIEELSRGLSLVNSLVSLPSNEDAATKEYLQKIKSLLTPKNSCVQSQPKCTERYPGEHDPIILQLADAFPPLIPPKQA
ncbi:MAG: hypothetical protein WCI72_02025 [archaeon]